MNNPKKKMYWLERWEDYYFLVKRKGGPATMDAPRGLWNRALAPTGSPLRLIARHRIRISITPSATGFSVRAIGKPEKIGDAQ